MRGFGTAGALIALAASMPAFGQTVTLTKDDGRPLIVGDGTELGSGLSPSDLAGNAIVAEFQRLCMPEPASAARRAANSTFALQPGEAIFAPLGKGGEARVTQWRGASALLSIWSGDDANLRGRPVAIPSRGSTTTGAYGPFRAKGEQCNLVVMVKDFATATQISDALTSAFGAPGKLVAKKSFADGHWLVSGAASTIRVNFTTPSGREGPRPVHLSAQVVEGGKGR